jgi:hypothetical protein
MQDIGLYNHFVGVPRVTKKARTITLYQDAFIDTE